MKESLSQYLNIVDLLRSRFISEQIYDVTTWILAVHHYKQDELEAVINASGDTRENINQLMVQLIDDSTYPKEVFDCPIISKLTSNELIELYRSLVQLNIKENSLDILHSLWDIFFTHTNKEFLEFSSSPCFKQFIQSLSKEFMPGSTVYDATHGLGTNLLTIEQDVELYGQDINRSMGKYFIRHCLIRDHNKFQSFVGNTLSQPGFIEKKQVKQFDYCISEIPFGLRFNDMSAFEDDKYQRYLGDRIPKSASDSLWIQHIIASLNDNGKAFVLVPEGVLFRGGYDAKVREELLRQDYIEAIIKLPSGCMNSTSIPSVVLILNKAKSGSQKANVLIIDTTNEIKQIPHKNTKERHTLINQLIEQVSTLYTRPTDISGLSKIVSYMEILKKKQQLSPSIYIKIEAKVEILDIKQAQEEYKDAKKQFMKELDNFNQVFLN